MGEVLDWDASRPRKRDAAVERVFEACDALRASVMELPKGPERLDAMFCAAAMIELAAFAYAERANAKDVEALILLARDLQREVTEASTAKP